MTEDLRLFVAVELPRQVREALSALATDLREQFTGRVARWVRPENIHLTLKFLGDVSSDQVDAVSAAMQASVVGDAPFELVAEGLGVFPNPKRPRILWVGIGGEVQALSRVRASVEEHIAPLGYPTESRPFNPHLTLARAHRRVSRDEQRAFGALPDQADVGHLAAWRVGGIGLIRSQLKPGGAVYTQVAEAPLEGD